MNVGWLFEQMSKFQANDTPFIAYVAYANWGSAPTGCGIFRLDPVECCEFDEHDEPIVRKRVFTLQQMRRLVKSFKQSTPTFYVFLTKDVKNQAKIREIFSRNSTFIGEDNVSDDKYRPEP